MCKSVKDFTEGDKINCEILYGDSINIDIQCKLNICSNTDPNFGNADKGILRRGLMIKYTQRFLPVDLYNKELKDGKKNIHLRKDGMPDMRYKENRIYGFNKDGSRDKRCTKLWGRRR